MHFHKPLQVQNASVHFQVLVYNCKGVFENIVMCDVCTTSWFLYSVCATIMCTYVLTMYFVMLVVLTYLSSF